MHKVLGTIACRLGRLLARLGLLDDAADGEAHDRWADEMPLLACRGVWCWGHAQEARSVGAARSSIWNRFRREIGPATRVGAASIWMPASRWRPGTASGWSGSAGMRCGRRLPRIGSS